MLRTHRQRVPAMLVVACVGMMVYAVAGAAPDDGQQLSPAAKSSTTTSTTGKDGKGSTPSDDCKGPTTSTTEKDGGGKGPTTSTTEKDGGGKGPTTSTTEKDDGGKGPTTSTTEKDDGGKGPTTSTTEKDDGGKGGSTPTTADKGNVSPKAAVNAAAADKTTATTTKNDASKAAADDDCEPTTPTTDKGGKGSTTTTRKSGDGKDDGKNPTTTTTDRKDRPTTTTTEKHDTVEPTTPSDPGSGGGDSGGTTDPGATPIEPQEAPPFDPSYDQPADPGADDPGADDGWYEMPAEGPVAMDGDEYDIEPMAAPGEAEPVIPTFSRSNPRSGGKASVSSDRPDRRRSGRGGDQELAAPPLVMSSSGVVQASPGQSQSAAVSRNLGGLQTSVTESAFPADIISTPKIFPVNRRDPLAAAALVLLVGVSRELFKAWRRRVSDYWPA